MDLEKTELTANDKSQADNMIDDLWEAIADIGEEYECERLILHFGALRAILKGLEKLPESLDAEFCVKASEMLQKRAAAINNANIKSEFEMDTVSEILH